MWWTVQRLDKLEAVQNRVGRLALGANKYATAAAVKREGRMEHF